MVWNSDGKIDGIIKIQKGQGITQAIATELGEEKCKGLSLSIWNQIIEIAKDDSSYEQDSKKLKNKETMIVYEGDVFKFTKEAFNKIIKLINDATKYTGEQEIKLDEENPANSKENTAKAVATTEGEGEGEGEGEEEKENKDTRKSLEEVKGATNRYDKAVKEAENLKKEFQEAINDDDLTDFVSGENVEIFGCNKDIEDWEENGDIDAICFMLAEDDDLSKELANNLSPDRKSRYMKNMIKDYTGTNPKPEELINAAKEFKSSLEQDKNTETYHNVNNNLKIESSSIKTQPNNTTKTVAENQAKNITNEATNNEDMEHFARYKFIKKDIKAQSFMLADENNEEIANNILDNMLEKDKQELMKKLCDATKQTIFDDGKIYTNEEIINEARTYKEQLVKNAEDETKKIDDITTQYNNAIAIFSEMYCSAKLEKKVYKDKPNNSTVITITDPQNPKNTIVVTRDSSNRITKIKINGVTISNPSDTYFKIGDFTAFKNNSLISFIGKIIDKAKAKE